MDVHAPLFGSVAVDGFLDPYQQIAVMLEVEIALCRGHAEVGSIPVETAERVIAGLTSFPVDVGALTADADAHGNIVIPLVAAVRKHLPGDVRWALHRGATSQDIVDTASMVTAHRALAGIVEDLQDAADAAAELAREHRSTPMAGRTLQRTANPVTFGSKAARWMRSLDHLAAVLAAYRSERLAVQLGGPVGSGIGFPRSVELSASVASQLGLRSAPTSWHTDRDVVAELATSLARTIGAAAKVGTDVALLTQDEVAELRISGAGGSSSMPHKRNPVDAVILRAAALRAPGLAGTVLSALPQEHERAMGSWHAEWQPVAELLHLTGGAARRVAGLLRSIEVDADRMVENLRAAGDGPLLDRVMSGLSEVLGAEQARVRLDGWDGAKQPLQDWLAADEVILGALGERRLRELTDPSVPDPAAVDLTGRLLEARVVRTGEIDHGDAGDSIDGPVG